MKVHNLCITLLLFASIYKKSSQNPPLLPSGKEIFTESSIQRLVFQVPPAYKSSLPGLPPSSNFKLTIVIIIVQSVKNIGHDINIGADLNNQN